MKLKLGDKIYDAGAISDLSLKYVLQLEKETRDFGRPLTAQQLDAIGREIQALPEKERAQHPDVMWLTAVSIWAARKLAGEDVTFEQAIDFPMSSLSLIPDPEDHKNPTKARHPKGSGQAKSHAPAQSLKAV